MKNPTAAKAAKTPNDINPRSQDSMAIAVEKAAE